ncbi:MAG TPA: hypothetical protein VIM19_13300, partial [Actinomycetes bacterium]
ASIIKADNPTRKSTGPQPDDPNYALATIPADMLTNLSQVGRTRRAPRCQAWLETRCADVIAPQVVWVGTAADVEGAFGRTLSCHTLAAH